MLAQSLFNQEYVKAISEMLSERTGWRTIRLHRVPELKGIKTYGELVEYLMGADDHRRCTPFAIYRTRCTDPEYALDKGYIYTNPAFETVLRPSDVVHVFHGEKAWTPSHDFDYPGYGNHEEKSKAARAGKTAKAAEELNNDEKTSHPRHIYGGSHAAEVYYKLAKDHIKCRNLRHQFLTGFGNDDDDEDDEEEGGEMKKKKKKKKRVKKKKIRTKFNRK